MRPTSILVIEDTDSDAALISRHLRADHRFTASRVGTLREAFATLGNGHTVEAVVLDLNLPDSYGLETFTQFHRRFEDTPVVILSGHEDEALAIEALSQGAQDYVPKTALNGPLLVRSLLFAIERNARLLAERRFMRVEDNLATAHKIQAHLLPRVPPVVPGFDIAGICEPVESCAGDFFDFIELPDGHLDVLVSDVSGHGVGPALIMAGARRILRSAAVMHNNLGDILSIANHAVAEDTLPEQFVTLFYMRLDPRRSTLTYCSAGHPAWVVRRDGGHSAFKYDSIPLGLMTETQYETDGTVSLNSGDVVVLMTDGIWETENTMGEFFGRDRVFEIVHRNRHRSASEIIECIVGAVRDFSRPAVLRDDVTIVLVKRL